MEWYLSQRVAVHAIGTDVSNALFTGEVSKLDHIGFELDADEGKPVSLTWETLKDYQVTCIGAK